jgi:hypothetical protein
MSVLNFRWPIDLALTIDPIGGLGGANRRYRGLGERS